MKKILGVIFVVIGVLLGLAFVAQLPRIIPVVMGAGSSSSYSLGYLLGTVVSCIIYLSLVAVLFGFGLKWLRATQPKRNIVLDEELLTSHMIGHKNDSVESVERHRKH